MGREQLCTASYKRRRYSVKLHLDGNALTSRGALRLTIPLKEVKSAKVIRGNLKITWGRDQISLNLGEQAEKWKERILSPPSRMDKLGVKAGFKVSLLGIKEPQFMRELKTRTADITHGSAAADSDIVFLAAGSDDDLAQLGSIAESINKNGSIWVVWAKGRKDFKESNVRRAALAHRLVDVKVASFSDTLSALKLVIPKVSRI